VRNLKLFISLVVEISPFGRNDKNGDCDTDSLQRGTVRFMLSLEGIVLFFVPLWRGCRGRFILILS
jgi:hypothetical protein